MNLKIWIPLSAAVVTGGAAAYIGLELLSKQQGHTTPAREVKLADVVVAARPLPPGTALQAADLMTLRVETTSAPKGAMADVEQLVGRVLADSVGPGQPLSAEVLAGDDAVPGLAAILPVGYRAIAIETNPYDGLAGFLLPEAHVDVVATLRGDDGGMVTRTVAQNLRVLAVNGLVRGQQRVVEGDENAAVNSSQSVTLLVTPEQAGAIELACEHGTPRLTLRAGNDQALTAFEGITLAELRGDIVVDAFANGDPFPRSPGGTSDGAATGPQAQGTPIGTNAQPPVETSAPPTTRPVGGEQSVTASGPPARRKHVVEVIRGGTITREAVLGGRDVQPQPRVPEQAVVNNDTKSATE